MECNVTQCVYLASGVCVLGLARVLCAYHGVPAPQNTSPALLLRVEDIVDILSTDDDFWWEVSSRSMPAWASRRG